MSDVEQASVDDKPASRTGGSGIGGGGIDLGGALVSFRTLLGLEPANRDEVHDLLFRKMVMRGVQLVLGIMSMAGAAATGGSGGAKGWMLAVSVFVMFIGLGDGVVSYLIRTSRPDLKESGFSASLVIDWIFAFMTMSAFSAGAGLSTTFSSGFGVGVPGSFAFAVAILFFSWLSFLFTLAASMVLQREISSF